MSLTSRQILLVCADRCTKVMNELTARGCQISVATSGQHAVKLARRMTFDLIVLISTDCDMDITETLFNLRDVQERSPIVVLVAKNQHRDVSTELGGVAGTTIVPLSDFSRYLNWDGATQLGEKLKIYNAVR